MRPDTVNPSPVRAASETVKGAFPVLESLIVWVLIVAIFTSPKSNEPGETESVPTDVFVEGDFELGEADARPLHPEMPASSTIANRTAEKKGTAAALRDADFKEGRLGRPENFLGSVRAIILRPVYSLAIAPNYWSTDPN